MSDEEIIAFTHEFYTKTGYEIAMERYEGRKFGFDEYVNLIESYEAAGYCIEAVLLDYANKMKKVLLAHLIKEMILLSQNFL